MKYYKSDQHKIEFVFSENSTISYGKHNHVSIYAVGLILGGAIMLERTGESLECVKDDLFIIPPYEVHATYLCDVVHTMVTLCIGVEFIENYNLEDAKTILKSLADKLICDAILNHMQVEAFTDAMEMVYGMYGNYNIEYSEMISYTKEIIEKHPETDMRLDELSQKIFVSKYYLIREFKKKIGLSPHNFQIQNRIRMAQQFLECGLNITETAIKTGFYDQSHFDKYFKKIVGITPSEYMDSLKKLL